MNRCKFAFALGALLICTLPVAAQSGWQPVTFAPSPDHIDVLVGGKAFTTYFFAVDAAKAYMMPLRTAQGTLISRDFPHGNSVQSANPKDDSFEPHQRPLYFGHGDINGFDFWGEEAFKKFYGPEGKARYGRMVLERLEPVQPGAESGTLRAHFQLMGNDGTKVARETQTFTIRGDAGTRIVDCEILIEAVYGPVTFGDTKEGSFALRLGPALSDPNVSIVNSNHETGSAVWGKRADWVDYSGTVGGEQAGVAVFDHPENLRHPTTWHARGYGLLAVNPFGLRAFTRDASQNGAYHIPAGASLLLRYRVVIHHGAAGSYDVAGAYTRYRSAGQAR
jgi:hypothetical protein